MYTVVIAEKKHFDCIKEYELFLQPFLDQLDAAFCVWDPSGQTLTECVPELRAALRRGDKWRALIVTDDGGQRQKNPFDRVRHQEPAWDDSLPDETNRKNRRAARMASYEKATKNPLSRLTACLCDYPLVTDRPDGPLSGDPDYQDYQAMTARKKELQKMMVGDDPQDFVKPAEVLCVARRTCGDESYDIRTSWSPHIDLQYSHFADYNLYYPKMRYIVFDVLPVNHRDYRFDNIRFLYTLLLLAGHDVPADALQPERVYVLDCENDNARLSWMLQRYDDRLLATQRMLEEEIAILQRENPEKLTDKEMRSIFCGSTHIAVRPEKSFDESEIYVGAWKFGLYADRPQDEKILWHQELQRSRKGLANYLRQPKKSVSAAVSDLHIQSANVGAVEKVHLLDEHQVGEFREYLAGEETAAVTGRPEDLSDPSRYLEKAEEAAEKVDAHLETRLTRKTALLSIGLALLVFIIGLIPVLFTGSMSLPLGLTLGGSVILLLLAGAAYLFVRRRKLRRDIKDYNDILHGISDSIRQNMERYSAYLGHVCSLIRGNTADNRLREDDDEQQDRCKIYRKHLLDIRELRAKWGMIFGQFLPAGREGAADVQPFAYDYRNTTTYLYPINGIQKQYYRVEFLQTGNTVELPVDYVKGLTLRREELYD